MGPEAGAYHVFSTRRLDNEDERTRNYTQFTEWGGSRGNIKKNCFSPSKWLDNIHGMGRAKRPGPLVIDGWYGLTRDPLLVLVNRRMSAHISADLWLPNS